MFPHATGLTGVAVFAVSGALAAFLTLSSFGAPARVPSLVGMAVIVALRLATIVGDLRVPAFSLERE